MIKNQKNIITNFNHILKYILALIIILLSVSFIKYTKQVSSAIVTSIESCINIIIPSLFSFMVISNILVKSNIYIIISKPFYLVAKYIMKIPPELFSVFLLSNIGGYPVGAKLITSLYESDKISKKEAERMMSFCYCNSPAFFSGAVGLVIFKNVLAGFLIYVSIVVSNFTIAIITGLRSTVPKSKKKSDKIILNAKLFVDSATSAANTLFLICVMIIIFAGLIAVLDALGIINVLSSILINSFSWDIHSSRAVILSFFEISRITQLPLYCYGFSYVIAVLGAFGGICVIAQIVAITSGKISLKCFFATRPLHFIISAVIAKVLFNHFYHDIAINTAVTYTSAFNMSINPIIPSICLAFMTILLIFQNKPRFY